MKIHGELRDGEALRRAPEHLVAGRADQAKEGLVGVDAHAVAVEKNHRVGERLEKGLQPHRRFRRGALEHR